MIELRDLARALFQTAVHRADPVRALQASWQANALSDPALGRCFVLAIGKAAVPMMRVALDMLSHVDSALVITNAENAVSVTGARVMQGAHPVPDESSVAAGRAVLDLLQGTGPGDHVIALISGGGTALMAAPAGAISLADYQQVSAALLGSGLDIAQINLGPVDNQDSHLC